MMALSSTRKVTLGELGSFRNGMNFKKEQMGSGLKLINVKDIFGDGPRIDFETLDLVALEGVATITRYTVQANDIFFVRSSVKRDGVGLVRLANRRRDDTVHCGFVIRYRLEDEQADPLFLTYQLRSPQLRQAIINISGGAAITNISQSSLASLEINLPPLLSQRRIASILSAYDDLIENNLRRIKILEEMAQNLYREWFVKFRFPGHEKVKMVESELGMIPDGWGVVRLSGVTEVNSTCVKKGSAPGNIVYVTIKSVSTGSIDAVAPMPFSEAPSRARRVVQHGDTIWSSVRPNRRSYSLVLNPPENMIVSTGFAVIRPMAIPYTYCYYATTTDDFAAYLTNRAKGAAYPAVSADDFEGAVILKASAEVLDQFHSIVEPMVLLSTSLRQRNITLRRARDLLLPKLISGEIDVLELDIEIEERDT